MPSVADRLLERPQAAGVEVPGGARLERTYYGRHQESAGAWTWRVMHPVTGRLIAGSKETMTSLVAARRWTLTAHFDEITASASLDEGPLDDHRQSTYALDPHGTWDHRFQERQP